MFIILTVDNGKLQVMYVAPADATTNVKFYLFLPGVFRLQDCGSPLKKILEKDTCLDFLSS